MEKERTPDKDDYRKAFDFAADVRKFEIGLFWQRSLFFWGFITTTTVAFGAAYQLHHRNMQFAAAAIGFISAFGWTIINRSSLYWQRHWELELTNLQKHAIGYEIYGDAANHRITIEQGWFWKPKHYSPSKLAIAFSDFVVLIWLVLFCVSSPLWPILRESACLSWLSNPYAFTLLVVAATVACLFVLLRYARPTKIDPNSK